MANIKISSNLFEQDKMRVIDSLKSGKTYIYVFLRLLCIATKADANGELKIFDNEYYTPEIMSNFFSLPLNLLKESLEVLQKYGLITVIDSIYSVANYDEYALEDKAERKRKLNNERQKRFAEKRKSNALGGADKLNIAQSSDSDKTLLEK